MRWAINVEGAIAILFVALVVVRAKKTEDGRRKTEGAPIDLLYAVGLLLIVIAAFWKSLWFPLVSDDYILVTQAAQRTGSLLKSFFEPGGDGSYRPIGNLLLLASGGWAHAGAFRWHVISLAVHAVNSLLVYASARYAFRRIDIAAIAATIFALHGTRPEAVAWVAGRWDVPAAFFALLGLLAFLRYYDTGNWIACAASVLLIAVAIMCKESAYAFPALAVAFVAAREFQRRLLAAFIAPVLMLAYRFVLFHGPGGYIDPQTGRAQILSIHFLPTLKALFVRLWGVLLLPIDWAKAPEFYLAAATVLMLACLAVLCVTRSALDRRTALLLAGCTMAAALPAVHLLGIGADLLGSRVLYIPGVTFALFLSMVVTSVQRVQLARALAACIVVFYAATLAHNLGIWGRVAGLADRTCVVAATAFNGAPEATVIGIPVAIDGVNFFANGLAECVSLHSTAPPSKWTITHDARDIPKPSEHVLRWDGESNLCCSFKVR